METASRLDTLSLASMALVVIIIHRLSSLVVGTLALGVVVLLRILLEAWHVIQVALTPLLLSTRRIVLRVGVGIVLRVGV